MTQGLAQTQSKEFEASRRLLQRGEFGMAALRLEEVYRQSNKTSGPARRLAWLAHFVAHQRETSVQSDLAATLEPVIPVLGTELVSQPPTATTQVMRQLNELAHDYPDERELSWLAAEARLPQVTQKLTNGRADQEQVQQWRKQLGNIKDKLQGALPDAADLEQTLNDLQQQITAATVQLERQQQVAALLATAQQAQATVQDKLAQARAATLSSEQEQRLKDALTDCDRAERAYKGDNGVEHQRGFLTANEEQQVQALRNLRELIVCLQELVKVNEVVERDLPLLQPANLQASSLAYTHIRDIVPQLDKLRALPRNLLPELATLNTTWERDVQPRLKKLAEGQALYEDWLQVRNDKDKYAATVQCLQELIKHGVATGKQGEILKAELDEAERLLRESGEAERNQAARDLYARAETVFQEILHGGDEAQLATVSQWIMDARGYNPTDLELDRKFATLEARVEKEQRLFERVRGVKTVDQTTTTIYTQIQGFARKHPESLWLNGHIDELYKKIWQDFERRAADFERKLPSIDNNSENLLLEQGPEETLRQEIEQLRTDFGVLPEQDTQEWFQRLTRACDAFTKRWEEQARQQAAIKARLTEVQRQVDMEAFAPAQKGIAWLNQQQQWLTPLQQQKVEELRDLLDSREQARQQQQEAIQNRLAEVQSQIQEGSFAPARDGIAWLNEQQKWLTSEQQQEVNGLPALLERAEQGQGVAARISNMPRQIENGLFDAARQGIDWLNKQQLTPKQQVEVTELANLLTRAEERQRQQQEQEVARREQELAEREAVQRADKERNALLQTAQESIQRIETELAAQDYQAAQRRAEVTLKGLLDASIPEWHPTVFDLRQFAERAQMALAYRATMHTLYKEVEDHRRKGQYGTAIAAADKMTAQLEQQPTDDPQVLSWYKTVTETHQVMLKELDDQVQQARARWQQGGAAREAARQIVRDTVLQRYPDYALALALLHAWDAQTITEGLDEDENDYHTLEQQFANLRTLFWSAEAEQQQTAQQQARDIAVHTISDGPALPEMWAALDRVKTKDNSQVPEWDQALKERQRRRKCLVLQRLIYTNAPDSRTEWEQQTQECQDGEQPLLAALERVQAERTAWEQYCRAADLLSKGNTLEAQEAVVAAASAYAQVSEAASAPAIDRLQNQIHNIERDVMTFTANIKEAHTLLDQCNNAYSEPELPSLLQRIFTLINDSEPLIDGPPKSLQQHHASALNDIKAKYQACWSTQVDNALCQPNLPPYLTALAAIALGDDAAPGLARSWQQRHALSHIEQAMQNAQLDTARQRFEEAQNLFQDGDDRTALDTLNSTLLQQQGEYTRLLDDARNKQAAGWLTAAESLVIQALAINQQSQAAHNLKRELLDRIAAVVDLARQAHAQEQHDLTAALESWKQVCQQHKDGVFATASGAKLPYTEWHNRVEQQWNAAVAQIEEVYQALEHLLNQVEHQPAAEWKEVLKVRDSLGQQIDALTARIQDTRLTEATTVLQHLHSYHQAHVTVNDQLRKKSSMNHQLWVQTCQGAFADLEAQHTSILNTPVQNGSHAALNQRLVQALNSSFTALQKYYKVMVK